MIRKAQKKDADFVVSLLFEAMPEVVFKMTESELVEENISFLKELFLQEKNQYSYQNFLVFEIENKVVASLGYYNGGDLQKLREPVLQLIQKKYGKTIVVEDETQAGEWYIDTLSVAPKWQGKGIASSLLNFLKTEKKECVLGLLVEENNIKAQHLYQKLGFVFQQKKSLLGGTYFHLQW